MSFILGLTEETIFDKLPAILTEYETKILEAEPVFKLEGKKLETVMRTLPAYLSYFDQAFQELKHLTKHLENFKAKQVGVYWKKYNEKYSRQLSSRDIQAYIEGESLIVDINTLITETSLLESKFEAIVESLKQLGWMCGHITKLRIEDLQETIM